MRGRYIIGGVAGLNLTNASITYNTSNTSDSIPVTVQANECAGGVAGVNCGNIALGSTTLRVNITAESYAGGIAGSNNMRNATTASIAGGNVTGHQELRRRRSRCKLCQYYQCGVDWWGACARQ